MKKFFSSILVSVCLFAFTAAAQNTTNILLFGNSNQPGYSLHQSTVDLVDQGQSVDFASRSVLYDALSDDSSTLSETAKNSLKLNNAISLGFISAMVEYNDLFMVTKTLIEAYPENASDIVGLSVSLYPEYAQLAIDAATITGEINAEDALIAAISAGADPANVSSATAAGPTGTTIVAAPVPLGAGIGSAGSGGGDSTASNN
jgi:hypothetical protein